MPVSSYIVRCRAELRPRVREALRRLPGVTLGPAGAAGLTVVAETDSLAATEALEARLRDLPHVRDAVPVYLNFEDVFPTASAAASASSD
jgi:nitrate reductase NapAB chaperone NapD